MNLDAIIMDGAIKQKKGLHFILASVVIWSILLIIHLTDLPILTKNIFTLCATAPLMPLALLFSKLIKVDFSNKGNPLAKLGIIISLNQLLYLPIVMWVLPTVPDKMLMVFAMVFGAHLFPFGWLYKSKTYTYISFVITILALIVGCLYEPYILALMMVVFEITFCVLLKLELTAMTKTR
jgi:hypothetical protein